MLLKSISHVQFEAIPQIVDGKEVKVRRLSCIKRMKQDVCVYSATVAQWVATEFLDFPSLSYGDLKKLTNEDNCLNNVMTMVTLIAIVMVF